MSTPNQSFSIAAVERETGLSKDVLRKWEVRYGFPAPLRDDQGERSYPLEQVRRLRLIKWLMDAGLRPSRLMGADDASLAALALAQQGQARPEAPHGLETAALALLRAQDPEGLRQCLHRALLSQGVERFVLDTVAPLNQAVGEAWAQGTLGVHEEHLYTETLQWLLRNAMAEFANPQGRPRVLLTTLPEEPHGLGILMVATLLALKGAYCVSLGTQIPAPEIALAVQAHRMDLLVLSFSVAYPRRRLPAALEEVRRCLGDTLPIWVGGAGTARLTNPPPGIRRLARLEDALGALAEWREHAAS